MARPVLTEAAAGDADAAARQLAALDGIPILAVGAEALGFAGRLLSSEIVPAKASIDAIHIAVAAVRSPNAATIDPQQQLGGKTRKVVEGIST